MKLRYKPFPILIFLFLLSISASAASVTIMVGGTDGMSFVPSGGVTVNVGDTIKWVWENGSHTTTSTTIPSGAAAWDEPIDAADSSFSYIPTIPGVYNYKCIPHAAMGMIGSFTVTDTATDISSVAREDAQNKLYPNPATSTVQVRFKSGLHPVFEIYALNGRKVTAWRVINQTEASATLNISALAPGSYFLKMYLKNSVVGKRLLIENNK